MIQTQNLIDNYLIIFFLSFFSSFLSVPLVKKIALKLKMMDIPNKRKMHAEPIALMGGVSIAIGFYISAIYILNYINLDIHEIKKFTGILLGSGMIFIVGLLDDKFNIGVKTKFLFQILAGIILIYFGIRLSLFIKIKAIGAFLTVLWVVGITNSFNLLDNMDGLSSGVAAIASLVFFIVAIDQSQYLSAFISLALFSAALGFLPFNFAPASIFMGDAGSMFLGFIISSNAVICTYLARTLLTRLPIIIPLLILSIPLYDTFSVMLIRLKLGISIFKADKRHFSHRLVNLGLKPKYAVLIIYLATISTSMTATLLPHVNRFDAILILIHNIMIFAIIAILEWAGTLK